TRLPTSGRRSRCTSAPCGPMFSVSPSTTTCSPDDASSHSARTLMWTRYRGPVRCSVKFKDIPGPPLNSLDIENKLLKPTKFEEMMSAECRVMNGRQHGFHHSSLCTLHSALPSFFFLC